MISDTKARSARPLEKKYSIADIRGLHLDVLPSGRKIWRFRYTRFGKRSWFTIGEYPAVSIAEARERVPMLRQRIKDGDPLESRPAMDMRFETVAEMWMEDRKNRDITDTTRKTNRRYLRLYILPHLKGRDIRKITPADILELMRQIADTGKLVTMTRTRNTISLIFRFAAANGYPVSDPCSVLHGAISVPQAAHHPSPKDPQEIARLLKAINAYPYRQVRLAMLFSIYTFCRPGEMLNAEWSEVDLENREWRVPAEKMKMRRPHIVPLSRQLVDLLGAMKFVSDGGRYIFPHIAPFDPNRTMSHSAIPKALKRLGFSNKEITPHGFRSMASTLLNEQGFNCDWIERQLAHVERNSVRAAYNHADYLKERRQMMQDWADYLDKLRGEPIDLMSDQGHPSPRRKKARP